MPNADATLRVEFNARRPLLQQLAATLEEKTREALEGVSHIDRIGFRVKDTESFMTKAGDPKYTSPLTQIEDQVAGRVITFFRDDIQIVRDQITSYFRGVEHEVKEPENATEFGYESDHYIFVIAEHWKPEGWAEESEMPVTVELQIRTLFMHAWAEPQHDIGYKANVDRITQRELAWIAASAWGADHKLNELADRFAGQDSD
ncbi:MAG: RelA/SpoT domain-containing protein [Micrococcales bacterium]|nr:RelA/SpoT domain-containing protein [Micrococcales bacterium]